MYILRSPDCNLCLLVMVLQPDRPGPVSHAGPAQPSPLGSEDCRNPQSLAVGLLGWDHFPGNHMGFPRRSQRLPNKGATLIPRWWLRIPAFTKLITKPVACLRQNQDSLPVKQCCKPVIPAPHCTYLHGSSSRQLRQILGVGSSNWPINTFKSVGPPTVPRLHPTIEMFWANICRHPSVQSLQQLIIGVSELEANQFDQSVVSFSSPLDGEMGEHQLFHLGSFKAA